jgi:hypothetical protein
MKKYHPFNLFTANLPQGYRFLKMDEIILITDRFFLHNLQDLFEGEVGKTPAFFSYDFSDKYGKTIGFCRKL